jgi:hypothetical protein
MPLARACSSWTVVLPAELVVRLGFARLPGPTIAVDRAPGMSTGVSCDEGDGVVEDSEREELVCARCGRRYVGRRYDERSFVCRSCRVLARLEPELRRAAPRRSLLRRS